MKRTDQLLFIGLLCVSFTSAVLAQVDSIQRRIVDVPNVDPGAITIDGQMNEPAWANAAHADLVTQSGFDIWAYDYYRTSLTEPDYDAWYARMLWAKDTLYLFVHIDEVVNDSTNLYWNGKFTGDQLFVSLSNRLGVAMEGNYDGNPYAAPDGPFHFWVLGNKVTLNDSQATNIPPRYRRFPADTVRVFDAHDIARWATTIMPTSMARRPASGTSRWRFTVRMSTRSHAWDSIWEAARVRGRPTACITTPTGTIRGSRTCRINRSQPRTFLITTTRDTIISSIPITGRCCISCREPGTRLSARNCTFRESIPLRLQSTES